MAYATAKGDVERALALDDDLAEAHNARAMIRFLFDWDWVASEEEFQRAIELKPDYLMSYSWYGLLLFALGRETEAEEVAHKAQELRSLSAYAHSITGFLLILQRRYEKRSRRSNKHSRLLRISSSLCTSPALHFPHAGGIRSRWPSSRRPQRSSERAAIFLGWLGWPKQGWK